MTLPKNTALEHAGKVVERGYVPEPRPAQRGTLPRGMNSEPENGERASPPVVPDLTKGKPALKSPAPEPCKASLPGVTESACTEIWEAGRGK